MHNREPELPVFSASGLVWRSSGSHILYNCPIFYIFFSFPVPGEAGRFGTEGSELDGPRAATGKSTIYSAWRPVKTGTTDSAR